MVTCLRTSQEYPLYVSNLSNIVCALSVTHDCISLNIVFPLPVPNDCISFNIVLSLPVTNDCMFIHDS